MQAIQEAPPGMQAEMKEKLLAVELALALQVQLQVLTLLSMHELLLTHWHFLAQIDISVRVGQGAKGR